MSCTDGPCNPVAGGTGTLTFTAAPDSEYLQTRKKHTRSSELTPAAFIYTATFAGGM